MKFKLKNRYSTTLALIAIVLLTGCSTTKTMYGWNDYQPEVYAYFQGGSAEEQIINLEKNLEQFKARDQLAPPGFHAHLGMLFAEVGNMDRAAQEFNTEKRLFPESAPYMNFLLNKKDSHKTAPAKPIAKNVTSKNQTAIAPPVSSSKNQKKEQ